MTDLETLLPREGRGVIATAGRDGTVNTAVYARPHVTGPETLAWGMTEGRTWGNVKENPKASYLYMAAGKGFAGVRLGLVMERTEDGGAMLQEVRARTAEVVSPAAAGAVKHVAHFRVVEIRPLV